MILRNIRELRAAVSDDSIIRIRDLDFAYGETPVLQNVGFDIARGDFVCIVGPNGGGKTTLLRLMLGLLRPDRGAVRVFGRAPHDVRERIGYMPQHAALDSQFPIRVRDVVLMGRLRRWRVGPMWRKDRQLANAALEEVRLGGFGSRPFAALSGGQRQRVLIARALVCAPDLLLLDEPTANLDPLIQDEMVELLRELNRRMTIILVSHDVGFVAQQVRTVVCVNGDAKVHSAEDITGESIRELYGHDVQLVHHHHHHSAH